MKTLVTLFFCLLSSVLSYAQYSKQDSLAALRYIDSLHTVYSQEDFEQMRINIISDSTYMHLVSSKVENGDMDYQRLKVILETPFDIRFAKTGLATKETNMVYFAITSAAHMRQRFDELDQQLKQANHEVGEGQRSQPSDSLRNHIDSIMNELRKNVIEHKRTD